MPDPPEDSELIHYEEDDVDPPYNVIKSEILSYILQNRKIYVMAISLVFFPPDNSVYGQELSTPQQLDHVPEEFESGLFYFHLHLTLSSNPMALATNPPRIQVNNDWQQSIFQVQFNVENQTISFSSNFMVI